MNTRYFALTIAFFACIVKGPNLAAQSDLEKARTSIAARVEALQNIRAEYTLVQEFMPLNPNRTIVVGGGAGALVPITKPQKYTGMFSFLNGAARWESKMSEETVKQILGNFPVVSVGTYKNGRLEFLVQRSLDKTPVGIVDVPVEGGFFETGLGVRFYNSQNTVEFITVSKLRRMETRFNAEHFPVLTDQGIDGKRYEYTFQPDAGYALTKINVVNPPGGHNADPNEIVAKDFKLVSGIPLPFTIIQRVLRNDGSEAARFTASVISYVLNDPENKSERYELTYPKGVEIHDRRTDSFVTTDKEGEAVDEKRFGELLKENEQKRADAFLQSATQPATPATQP